MLSKSKTLSRNMDKIIGIVLVVIAFIQILILKRKPHAIFLKLKEAGILL